ncbi:DgyrCDS7967 [Dimorphilus gyrociliatus]|uniref:Very-long-chain (3R)-3-hydroxyacyl-CoA dehydratase n=1 Tax=Dimorphilus gyrociliatus TaxID=2664684 RepID=A0A7I8VUG4_9ANNE|nr:DgyrCDS7967 [Dimorphilus gyrociliatus]
MATEKSQKTPPNQEAASISTLYLVVYNVVQFFGWFMIFYGLINAGSTKSVFKICSTLLYIFQTAAILEVVHAALGLVKSNVFLTFFQVLSRVFVVWGISYSVPETRATNGTTMYLAAWSITEIVRYAYYAINLLSDVPYFIVWARYTFFIVLYPIGVTGELLVFYNALPSVKKSGLYSFHLPNKYNFSFDYYTLLIIGMLTYIPIFPQLYMHMFKQRGKFVSTPKDKEEAKKTK